MSQESHYELVSRLYRNYLAAQAEGKISLEVPYRPIVSSNFGPSRALYCQDANGIRIDSIGGIEVTLDMGEEKRTFELDALNRVLTAQTAEVAEIQQRKGEVVQSTGPSLKPGANMPMM